MNTLYELIISEKPEYLDSDTCVVSIDEISNICNNYITMEKEGKIIKNTKAVGDILICLCEAFGFTVSDIKQRCRKKGIVTARQMFYKYTCDNAVLGGLRERGELFGQDHATVLHGKRTINNLLQTKDHYVTTMWNKFNTVLNNKTAETNDNTRIAL